MYDEDLTNLEDWLRRLKVEYTIYFNGHRKRPPDDLRMRVEKLVKRLSEVGDMSYSQRFRYNTLVTRFYVLRDLWRRTMSEREAGESAREEPAPVSAEGPAQLRPPQALKVTIQDPYKEEEKVRKLYEALLGMTTSKAKQAAISYEQFVRYISTQTRALQEKFGCTGVEFNIAQDKGSLKFTARAENPHAS